MVRRSVTGTTTFEEFCDLIHEDQKADLLDGVIYLASPENTHHNELVFWLGIVLKQFADERQLGHLTINKVAYRLSDDTAPEPDLGFVRANRRQIIKPGYIDGPPDLAVEIVSPDSVDRDYEMKRLRYEAAGVLEYWIIDPMEQTATFLVREGGSFVEQHPQDHVFESHVLTGLRMDTRWLFQRPLPPTLSIIRLLIEQ